jgi:hypothetical protein
MSHPTFGGVAQRGGENITSILRFPRGLLQFRYRYKLGYSEPADNFYQYFLDSVAYIMNSNTYFIRYGPS